jgi:hypothetical protein
MESTMGNSKPVSMAVFFILLVALSFEQGAFAATLFPNRAQAWTKIPTVVVSGKEGDPRTQLVIDAVDFWNQQLSEIGSAFRLGPVTFTNGIIPDLELERRSDAVFNGGQGAVEPPSLIKIRGDIIVALSDADLVSFARPSLRDGRRLVVIRGYQHPPLTLPDVARNVIAHELGHAIGLGHNNDPAYLMCGRPASCRPIAFQSGGQKYFPLLEEEKQTLLRLYPLIWKAAK